MDKYLLALLGEAGASGLAKAYYVRYKNSHFREAFENEVSHWNYFRNYKRSILEKPTYYALFVFGILTSLLGFNVVKKVVRFVENNAIKFYERNFAIDEDIKKILEEEKKHMNV
ncbi:hypothetical protein [Acidianus sp. HS-5]|uniref:hypothetical protein n=1 Tax=Acidianus sp. HS-5 TaxID=2886040 RepID=UPI001F17F683|nr:hypothetical protein [Acidianus sp. HS-5]BDC18448.1 hypothetical protein HS5_13380 [Acidianus sp. HS-5]